MFELRIDNPCYQPWTTMSGEGVDRFCSKCSTTVIDFTNLSDSEVIQVIQQSKGPLCGKLRSPQLNRPYFINNLSRQYQLRRLLAALVLIGAANISIAAPKVENPAAYIVSATALNNQAISTDVHDHNQPDTLKNVLSGTILDSSDGLPLPGVLLRIKSTKVSVTTDANGKFKLRIPKEYISKQITLVTSYIGYKSFEFTVRKKDLPKVKTVKLVIDQVYLGGISIIPYHSTPSNNQKQKS